MYDSPGQTPIPIILFEYQQNVENWGHCYDNAINYTDENLQHEVYEAITDPLQHYREDAGGPNLAWQDKKEEIGDKCQPFPIDIDPGSNLNPVAYRMLSLPPQFPVVNQVSVIPLWSNLSNSGQGACIYSYQTRFDNFYTGTDGNIWRIASGYAPQKWGMPNGVKLTSGPMSASWAPNRLDVFALQVGGTLAHFYSTDGGASIGGDNWGGLPAPYHFTSGVAVVAKEAYYLDLFAFGTPALGATHLLHKVWNTSGGTGWTDLGAVSGVIGAPAAASYGPNRLDVFWTTTSNHFMQATSTDGGATFAPFTDVGAYPNGTMTGGAAVASWGPGRLDVFATDSANNVAHRYSNYGSGGWDTWTSGGNPISGHTVTAVGLGDGRLLVTVEGGDGRQYQGFNDWGNAIWSVSGYYPVGAEGMGLSSW